MMSFPHNPVMLFSQQQYAKYVSNASIRPICHSGLRIRAPFGVRIRTQTRKEHQLPLRIYSRRISVLMSNIFGPSHLNHILVAKTVHKNYFSLNQIY
jgi:hypothetical protein